MGEDATKYITFICEECGIETTQPLKSYNRTEKLGYRHVCSHSCASAKHNKNQEGENNPNWRGGISDNNYEYKKRSIVKYPEKHKARLIFEYAVRHGLIERKPCVVCGDHRSEGHHEDYSKPLEVVWLCRKHHREWHKNRKIGKS